MAQRQQNNIWRMLLEVPYLHRLRSRLTILSTVKYSLWFCHTINDIIAETWSLTFWKYGVMICWLLNVAVELRIIEVSYLHRLRSRLTLLPGKYSLWFCHTINDIIAETWSLTFWKYGVMICWILNVAVELLSSQFTVLSHFLHYFSVCRNCRINRQSSFLQLATCLFKRLRLLPTHNLLLKYSVT